MSATQVRRMAAASPGEDPYWEAVYRRIREDRQARYRGDPGTFEGRRRIEDRAYTRIIALEDQGHRATDMTMAGLQIRSLRAKLNMAGALVPAQPRSRAIQHVAFPGRAWLR